MKRARHITAFCALLALPVLAACGSAEDPGKVSDAPDYSEVIADAPPELRRLYEKGGGVLAGGSDTFAAQVADLRGYPIVVNNWASWCVPCREEFPYFQAQAAEHLDEVAFLGVDSQDSDDAAATFLESHPIPYPSFSDPEGDFSDWVDTALVGIPNTLFYDRAGELVYVKQGTYTDEAALAADIEKYSDG